MIVDHTSATAQLATREFLQVARSEGRFTQVEGPMKSYIVRTNDVVASPVLSETIARRALQSEVS